MQLQVLSDLHLEFAPFEPAFKNPDVVVLAGDIHVGTAGVKWAKKFCRDCPVIYVPGNHEFYKHVIPDLILALKREAKGSNVNVLENNVCTVNGYDFLGCALWTDFNLGPEPAKEAMFLAWTGMLDYSEIQKGTGSGVLHPQDTANIHAASVRWLQEQLAGRDPTRTIVVTHHAPSSRSISPQNVGDVLSAAFASDLDSLIRASRIPLWIHGHTHYNVDYKIGGTRIYSNQRGYRHEGVPGFEPGNIIEIL